MKIILKFLMITTSVYAVSDKHEGLVRLNSDNLTEYGYFFEGDMILNDEQEGAIFSTLQRNKPIDEKYRWPHNTLFYETAKEFNADQVRAIEKALRTLRRSSCIRFKKRYNHTKDYVYVTAHQNGCYSEIGRQGKKQLLNLQPDKIGRGCFAPGRIMHQFMHALGFYHQQSAPDRDNYVKIVNDNILSRLEDNFQKYSSNYLPRFTIRYDYDSVMHYAADAFSKNGRATIVPLKKTSFKIGQRTHLSDGDIIKLNTMYNCY